MVSRMLSVAVHAFSMCAFWFSAGLLNIPDGAQAAFTLIGIANAAALIFNVVYICENWKE